MILQVLEQLVFELRGHPDRSDPLDIRMAADGHDPCPFASDHPSEQCQVDDRLDVLHAVGVVGDPHGPGEDGSLALRVHFGQLSDGRFVDATFRDDLAPRPCGKLC